MQILINIVVTLVLSFWFPMFMMSPMMFGAPGAVNDKATIINVMLFLCYPIGLFLLLGISGIQYFGIGGFKLTLLSAVIIAIAFSIFGYYGLLSNAIKGIASSGYSVIDDKAYYDAKVIEGADSRSFKILEGPEYRYSDYAVDKHHLYYSGKVVEGALAEDVHEIKGSGSMYWYNSRQVIHNDKVLDGAHPDSFTLFEGFTGWACSHTADQFQVFSYGSPLPIVDRDSFIPLNNVYARDKNQIFEKDVPILPQADPASFELMPDHDFGKDKQHVYYLSTKQPFIIEDADPDSFEVLERGYAKDGNNIFVVEQYVNVKKLEQADVSSFEVTEYDDATKSEAKDAKHYYYDGKIVGYR